MLFEIIALGNIDPNFFQSQSCMIIPMSKRLGQLKCVLSKAFPKSRKKHNFHTSNSLAHTSYTGNPQLNINRQVVSAHE